MRLSVFARLRWSVIGLLLPAMLSGCATTPGREQPFGYVVSTAYSPDGRIIAAATSDGEVALFEAQPLWFRRLLTRETDKRSPPRDYAELIATMYAPLPLAFSRDGTLLAAGGVAGNIVVWDVKSGTEKLRSPISSRIVDLVFYPDGGTLASAGSDVILWSLENGGHSGKLALPDAARATAAALSPDGRVLVVGLSGGEIAMFDATTRMLMRMSKEHEAPVSGLAFQQQGGIFASTAGGYDLRLWRRNQESGFEKGELPATAAASAAKTFDSAQGAGLFLWLLSSLRGFQITGAPTMGAPPLTGGAETQFAIAARTTPYHCGSRVAFSADGRYLLSTANLLACPDCIGRLAPAFLLFSTNLETGATVTVRDLGCEFAISPDSRTFANGFPGTPRIRDIVTGEPVPQHK